MKRTILLFLVLIPCYSFCQTGIRTIGIKTIQYYTKQHVLLSDSLGCYSYAMPYANQGIDTSYTYYCSNGKLFSRTTKVDGISEGPFYEYFENGAIKETGVYKKGRPIGDVENWYESGLKRSVRRFSGEFMEPSVLAQYWDITGEQIIKDGNGSCVCIMDETPNDSTIQKGELRDYKKQSIWTGTQRDKKLFVEEYNNGELKKGTSFDDDGTIYEYTKIEDPAMPEGGLQELYTFIGTNLKYPKRARRLGDEGTVYIAFVVGKDGTLTSFELLRGISPECDAEALRVVKLLPPWTPGKQRGKLIKTKYVLPIKFRLTR